MIDTQLIFQTEYRLDLNPLESVLIPYIFSNDKNLIINVDANPSRRYNSSGRIDQILIDCPDKTVASSQILRFGSQAFSFPEQGRFKLEFFPNYYLGKTNLSIRKMFFTSDPNGHPGFLPNRYYIFDPSIQNYTSLSGAGFLANTLTYIPWFVPHDVAIDKLAIYIYGANLNSKTRLGIYSNSEGYPHKLILDAGELDTSATGFKELNIHAQLKAGWYWLAGNSNVTPTIAAVGSWLGSQFFVGSETLALTNVTLIYRQSNVNYGVMPQEAVTSSLTRANYIPLFWFRVKS